MIKFIILNRIPQGKSEIEKRNQWSLKVPNQGSDLDYIVNIE